MVVTIEGGQDLWVFPASWVRATREDVLTGRFVGVMSYAEGLAVRAGAPAPEHVQRLPTPAEFEAIDWGDSKPHLLTVAEREAAKYVGKCLEVPEPEEPIIVTDHL
jgi:hypothetical protein